MTEKKTDEILWGTIAFRKRKSIESEMIPFFCPLTNAKNTQ